MAADIVDASMVELLQFFDRYAECDEGIASCHL